MNKILFLVSVSLLALISCKMPENKPKTIKLTIVESTDVHGSFFPDDLVHQRKAQGSLAQGMNYLRRLRTDTSKEVILLDNGDILQGTPSVYYANYIDTARTHLLARIMNFMQYDAASIGNHDIEAGPKVYEKFRKEINFPYLTANAIDSNSGKPHFKPYTIITRKEIKIAILGLITPSIPNWLPEKLWPQMYFDDMIESAKYWMNIIKTEEKPDIMIGLFHAGLDAEYNGHSANERYNENASKLVAQQVPGFDIVFAGHDHKAVCEKIVNIESDTVQIINAGAYAMNFGVVDITLKWNNEKNKYTKKILGSIVGLSDYKADSIFMMEFGSYFNSVKNYMNKKVVELKTTINSSDALLGPSSFVDMIHRIQLDISGADISFAAPFSIDIILDKGPLYIRDMFKLYRFENFLCTMRLRGDEIRNFLEFSSTLWFDSLTSSSKTVLLLKKDGKKDRYGLPLKNAYYNFDSSAGIKYTIDLSKNRGNRVRIISMTNGDKFDKNKMYKVVMNSYRANGGGDHLLKGVGLSKKEIKDRTINCSNEDFRRILTNWLSQKQEFEAKSMNNWELLPTDKVNAINSLNK
jgi:2',3'-cyclic-nucleotide 2'-phosphodiesterase/3'-nucleotidase